MPSALRGRKWASEEVGWGHERNPSPPCGPRGCPSPPCGRRVRTRARWGGPDQSCDPLSRHTAIFFVLACSLRWRALFAGVLSLRPRTPGSPALTCPASLRSHVRESAPLHLVDVPREPDLVAVVPEPAPPREHHAPLVLLPLLAPPALVGEPELVEPYGRVVQVRVGVASAPGPALLPVDPVCERSERRGESGGVEGEERG
jgi:hypothetical protein